MVTSNQLSPGMTININGKLYRVESSVKVNVQKGNPFIKATLYDLVDHTTVEKNFKMNQTLKEIALTEKKLEFLYLEGKNYLFLELEDLEKVLVPPDIVGRSANFLKEGGEVVASFFGEEIYAIDLPQFLELMVANTEESKGKTTNGTKKATLETGAVIEVPPFIEAGDILKVDTKANEYIQRV